MRSNQIKLLSLGLFILISAVPLRAEEALRGRLADGRAYRTDSQGIQLVDQVAELQVTVDTLKRQLEASENEVALKSSLIAEMQSAPVGELRCPPQPHLLSEAAVSGDNQEIHQAIVEELQKSQAEALAKVEARAQAEVTALKSELERVRTDSHDALAQAERARAKSEQVLDERYKEISLLRAKLKIADEQIALFHTNNGRTDSARASIIPSRVLSAGTGQPALEDEKRVRSQAAAGVKKSLKEEFTQVRAMLSERDALFQEHAGPGRELQLRPSTIQTSQNRTLDQLEKDVENETSLSMLSLMSRELHDIKEKISDDMSLIRRVGKL